MRYWAHLANNITAIRARRNMFSQSPWDHLRSTLTRLGLLILWAGWRLRSFELGFQIRPLRNPGPRPLLCTHLTLHAPCQSRPTSSAGPNGYEKFCYAVTPENTPGFDGPCALGGGRLHRTRFPSTHAKSCGSRIPADSWASGREAGLSMKI